jgi:signal transduction histidine kinase
LFHYYTTREGLPGNKVDGILEDARGRLWIATHQGLSCFDPEGATFRHYDSSDGLQGNRFSIGCRLRTRSGDLIFGGSNGFNRFDPEKLITNPVPPPVSVTSFRLFDREVSLDSLRTPDGLRLRSGDDFFSFEFAALDFGNPERNQYAYRLEGFDDDWVHSGSRRYAAYTNLDPGRYTFRVKAANSDGIWNEAGIAIPLQILPPFYRTWWFYFVTALAFGWAGWLAHRFRVRQHVAQFLALERVRVAERERIREQISRDYHDALGHKITKISLFSALAERNLESSEHAAIPYLRKVSEATQDLSRETRGFIWMLNPTKDHFYEVATHLHEFGTDLFEDTNVQVEVRGLDEGLRSIRVPVEWKRDVTLLFREALHNSLKHSNCGNVRLEFSIERGARASYSSTSHPVAGTARIELTDDGCGFTEPGANHSPSETESSARSSSGSPTRHRRWCPYVDRDERRMEASAPTWKWTREHVPACPNGRRTLGDRFGSESGHADPVHVSDPRGSPESGSVAANP